MNYINTLVYMGLIISLLALGISLVTSYVKIEKYKKQKNRFLINVKDSEKIPLETVTKAIDQINDYASDIAPDYILGVNRGGSMLGAAIALKLGIPTNKFVTCYVSPESVECAATELSGKVMIVDDISRSGRTLKMASQYVSIRYEKVEQNYTVALFSYVTNDKNPAFEDISYHVFSLSSPNALLPWNIVNNTSKRTQYDSILSESLERLANKISKSISKTSNDSYSRRISS